ncbi:hypothetical protein L1987_36193 [Smallanthus sonchifolius]|uniref:Uncharacterized protein n=1 Tax=Smallanthus sonchifolius TaxID=185202 RepID=A0ACB9HDQ7_9ASTR|nr:hypothetical protein L1987_36193 [Smallanthus sonchifolius]
MDALQRSRHEFKLMFVYLHSIEHPDTTPINPGQMWEKELQDGTDNFYYLPIYSAFILEVSTEASAVVNSYYDQRIVGCPGAEGAFESDNVDAYYAEGLQELQGETSCQGQSNPILNGRDSLDNAKSAKVDRQKWLASFVRLLAVTLGSNLGDGVVASNVAGSKLLFSFIK